jgi:hypothetical protein
MLDRLMEAIEGVQGIPVRDRARNRFPRWQLCGARIDCRPVVQLENDDTIGPGERATQSAELKAFFADVEASKKRMTDIKKNIKDLQAWGKKKLSATKVEPMREAQDSIDSIIHKTKDMCKEVKNILDRIKLSNEEFDKVPRASLPCVCTKRTLIVPSARPRNS